MKLRKILCILLLLMVVTGCSKSYERDTSKGEIIEITLAEMVEKIEAKDTFAIMFTTTVCNFCKEFESFLNPYIEDHHVVMYNVVLDKEEASVQENRNIIDTYFKNFSTTPGIFYVEEGEQVSRLAPQNNKIDKDMLDEWVQINQIDKKVK